MRSTRLCSYAPIESQIVFFKIHFTTWVLILLCKICWLAGTFPSSNPIWHSSKAVFYNITGKKHSQTERFTNEMFPLLFSFPCGSAGKESTCNVGDLGSIPGWGRSPGEGNRYLLQYACLENFRDKGAWQVSVHGSQRVNTTEQLLLTLFSNKLGDSCNST